MKAERKRTKSIGKVATKTTTITESQNIRVYRTVYNFIEKRRKRTKKKRTVKKRNTIR